MDQFKSYPRPTPRRLSDGSLESLFLVLCTVWIMGSAFILFLCAVSMGPDWYRYWQLSRTGVITSGELIRQDAGREWVSHIFRFTASTDQPSQLYTGQQAVKINSYQPLEPGQAISIRYLASNPEVSVIEQFYTFPSPPTLAFAGMGLLLLLIGLVLLPGRWRDFRKTRRLSTQGAVTSATIVNRWRTLDERQKSHYCVAYEFEAPQPTGAPKTILAAEYNELAYRTLRLHQTTPVQYIPEAPHICRLAIEPIIEKHR